jgi:hypothetical protein
VVERAVEVEAAGCRWHAARELALAPDRWSAEVANERGGRSRRLPDLVFWPVLADTLPTAVVVVHGPPKPRRERAALEGWHGSIAAGRYAQVRYVAGSAAADRLGRVAADIGLSATGFTVGERVAADERNSEVTENGADALPSVTETAPVPRIDPPRPLQVHAAPPRSRSEKPAETPEQAAERQKRINELLGYEDPSPRRLWRRRSA